MNTLNTATHLVQGAGSMMLVIIGLGTIMLLVTAMRNRPPMA